MRPDLVRIFGYPLPSYGVLIAAGILAAIILALVLSWRMRPAPVPAGFILDAAFWSVVAGFVGARVAYLALNIKEVTSDPLAAILGGGGGVFLAGAIAGIGAAVLVARAHKVSLGDAADVLAPALALGHAFGRIGCHLAGCCYGCLARPGWPAVRYPRLTDASGNITGSVPWGDQVMGGLIPQTSPLSLPVVPVQLIESAFLFVLVMALVVAWTRLHRRPGRVFVVYLCAYAVARFLLEFLRGDADRGLFAGLSTSQWVSLGLLIPAIVLLRRLAPTAPASSPPTPQ